MNDNKKLIKEIKELLINNDARFRELFLELHPYDQAQIIVDLDDEQIKKVISVITVDDVSNFFEYIEDEEDYNDILDSMTNVYASKVLSAMAVDDATDILKSMKPERRKKYLNLMDVEDVEEFRNLMKYQEDTAGSLMTTEYIELTNDMSVKQAMKVLIQNANEAETIYFLYVVDEQGVLVGTLSLKELILGRGNEYIKDIMTVDLIKVHALDDQEDVAYRVKDYDLGAIPVVDNKDRLLGIITVDDVLDVLEEEKDEDYARLAALSDAEIDPTTETVFNSVKNRLPWLVILLIVGAFTSLTLAQFEETLAVVPILTFFLPLILAMAGNTGTQSLAVTVRALSTNQFDSTKEIVRHLWRESKTGFINGLVVGILCLVFIYIVYNNIQVAIVVSMSLVVALTVATLSGALIPIIMHTLKIDPAVAAGPFITTINDIIAVTVYLALATKFVLELV